MYDWWNREVPYRNTEVSRRHSILKSGKASEALNSRKTVVTDRPSRTASIEGLNDIEWLVRIEFYE